MEKIAIAYIPVLHRGYMQFLAHCAEAGVQELYLIGDELLLKHEEFDYINRKDRLRALSVAEMKRAITAVCSMAVFELNVASIEAIREKKSAILTPKEDTGRVVCQAYFAEHEVHEYPISVRWNKDDIDKNVEPDGESIPMDEFQKHIALLMREEADKSFDWWRQVGVALIKDEEIVYVTHNTHAPEEQQPYIDGDARSLFKKGININYSTAAHAEVVALGRAAREGIKTEGAEIYVTDFPCPYCARLIASAGIKTVYFLSGYAVLEGDEYLKGEGVRVVKLQE